MSILYHSSKNNVIFYYLNWLSIGSTAHVEDEMMELAKDVSKHSCFGVRLMDPTERGIVVTNGDESSIVSKVK